MSEISRNGAKHHAGRTSVRWRRYYDQIQRTADDQHPVDMAVDKCLGVSVTRAQIARLQERVLAALGDKANLYLELEALVNERQREREQCFFDLGYEHGAMEKLARGRRGTVQLSKEAGALSAELRGLLVHAQVPSAEAMLVLLECGWAAVVGQTGE